MNRRLGTICFCLVIMFASFWPLARLAAADPPVVHAVLFYSQTCPHCYQVMTEDLPPLVEQYGEQLLIMTINTSLQEGGILYNNAADYYQVPEGNRGVPMLIVGDEVLIGSLDIPQRFPDIIENGLVDDGIDWPNIPEIHEILEAESIISDLEEETLAAENMTMTQRFAQDKAGNTLSVIALLAMIGLVARVGYVVTHTDEKITTWPHWIVPVLVLIGTAVALYMAYVEITQTTAVCGPVGDCNTVQQSSYAYLFGVIPIGAFGALGYVILGIIWLVASYGPVNWRKLSTLALWLLALFGVLFSIYLTFLEPFVIGASCAWCLTSAAVMTLLLWVTTAPAMQTWFANGR